MDQQFPKFYEDITLLSDCLAQGLDKQWSHELRKQILQLIHQLKSTSRQSKNGEVEAELVAVEVTLGYGKGINSPPVVSLVEDHQLRLLELADLGKKYPELSPCPDDEQEGEEKIDEKTEDLEQLVSENVDAKMQLILCNCPGRDVARELAHGLVRSRLVACVNIISNIGSIYWWDGEIKDTAECQLQIKTSNERLDDTLNYIKQNHPNTIPEILCFKVDKGNEDYFDWVKRETSDKQDD
ncbi:MAG: hypothetical protein COA74_13030 [Gammaproteobacteria bacterium]|nr:MAG: hypothetical protein COA74_13030 [Gammaproteobacteria bacterium]